MNHDQQIRLVRACRKMLSHAINFRYTVEVNKEDLEAIEAEVEALPCRFIAECEEESS